MENLLSWSSLVIALGALAVVLGLYLLLGRLNLTFRFRGAVTVSSWTQKPCPHLGLLDDPFIHQDDPTEEHRCYLWMQRDRIDLTHQKGFCLTSAHTHCPWLAITPVEKPPVLSRLKIGVANAGNSVWAVLAPAGANLLLWLILGLKRVGREIKAAALQVRGAPLRSTLGALKWLGGQLKRLPSNVRSFGSVAARGSGVTPAAPGSTFGATVQVLSLKRSSQASTAASPSQAEVAAEIPSLPTERPVAAAQPVPQRGSVGNLQSLLEQGKAADLAGNRKLAYSLFSSAIEVDPYDDEAWLWKGSLANNRAEKLSCFQKALALNPNNQKAQQALRELGQESLAATLVTATETPVKRGKKSRATTRKAAPGTAESLIEAALEVLESGDEEQAYRLCVTATETAPESEKAWFWRAKTATTLDEVIYSLQQALAINPENEKVRANLVWAIQRQQREEKAQEVEAAQAVAVAKKAQAKARPSRVLGLLVALARGLAALGALALSIYWIGVALMSLLNILSAKRSAEAVRGAANLGLGSTSSLYEIANRWFPGLSWASQPWYSRFEIASGYNVLAAAPYIIGCLYLFVAIGVLRGENWSRFWGLALTILSLALGLLYAGSPQAAMLVISLGLATGLTLLLSWRGLRPTPEIERWR